MSTGYDYTQDGQPANATTSDDFNPDDYSFIPLASAPDVEAIEQEAEGRDFKPLPPGDHELFVKGFKGRPVDTHRTGFLRGVQVSWVSPMVTVRVASVSDPRLSLLDSFDLPPGDAKGQQAYLYASKNQDGSNPGFMARKFAHFLNRLGFVFPEGAPIPPEACNLGNWVGRHIHASVIMQANKDKKINQQTGLPYPPRPQVKLFSYRPAESTVRGQVPQAVPTQARSAPVAQPAGRQASPSQGNPLAASGLNDL